MSPRDRDPAAPGSEPDGWPDAAPEGAPDAWATEESLADGDAPTDAEASASWLASAEGLVPPDAGRARPAGAVEPGTDLDFSATRVHPRPTPDPEDWGWNPPAHEPAGLVEPVARAAATPTQVPGPADRSSGDARSRAVDDDPYGRRAFFAEAAPTPAVQPVAAWQPAGNVDPRAWEREERASRRGIPWRRLLLSFVLGLLLTSFVTAGAIYAYEQSYADRILPNVRIGSVDVSGLTRDAARERLAATYNSFGEGAVAVTLAGKTTEIPYAAFDRRPDFDTMLDAAFAIGRSPSLTSRLIDELRAVTKGVTLQPAVLVNATKLEQRVHELAVAAEWDPVNAGAVVTATGFATTPSKAGQAVDEGTGAADAARQLAAIDAPNSVAISLTATAIPPAVSDASAQVATTQAGLMRNDITLTDGPDSWLIPAATVHRWLSFTIINNRVRIAIDTKTVLAEIKPLAEKIDREAVNATVKLQGTKIVFDKPSVEGRTLNASKTTTAVVNGLRNRALGDLAVDAPIPPVLALVQPALTTDAAQAAIPLMKEISSWTTNYQPSERNGNGANIKIPTTTINGFVVAPGETFSFWKAVGPVTRELGYTDGGAIIDGHTEPQGALGGGICSCSTTLYNAVIRAGYQMGDRLNHFYYINRYPLGLDATVFISASGQAQDMSWTNDSDYPVVIQGINGKGFVKFVLYSVPNGRTTTFSEPSVKNYTKAHTETRVDKTIPKGTRKQIEYATDGQDVWVTRTVKDKAGTVIHKETVYSHYATITGIILTNP